MPTKITAAKIKWLGFYASNKLKPRRFYNPTLDMELTILKGGSTMEDILLEISTHYLNKGIEKGKQMKVDEIKKILNINDDPSNFYTR